MRKNVAMAALAILLSSQACGLAADQGPAKGKTRVLITYGGHAFDEKPFFAMFDAMPDVAYDKAELPAAAGMLKPGLEKKYDVIVMYDMVSAIPAAQQQAFVDLLNQGIGLVSLHHNLGAHRDWDEFHKIIGGKYIFKPQVIDGKSFAHSGYVMGKDIKVTVVDKDHPITSGIKDFKIDDENYTKCYTSPDVKLLLTTDNPDGRSAAWVKQYGKSRVFFLKLGHGPAAWSNPNFFRILSNGIHWAAAGP